MSLYRKSNSNQAFPSGSFVPASGLPMWLLALAAYLAAMTLTNTVPEIISWLEGDLLKPEYMGYFLGNITSVLSVIALAFVLFRRNVFCLYFLMLATLAKMVLVFASTAGIAENLNSYFYSLQGLESIPNRIFGWLIGWDHVSEPIKSVVYVIDPVVSVAFCTFLIYFHSKRKPKNQSL
jgi:hypothetical protein